MSGALKKWFRENGSKAGKASAAKLTPQERTERARKAINARWAATPVCRWVCETCKKTGQFRFGPQSGSLAQLVRRAVREHVRRHGCKLPEMIVDDSRSMFATAARDSGNNAAQ